MEPAAGLFRLLLSGRAETTYICCTCGFESHHSDSVTGLFLALPEALSHSPAMFGLRSDGPQDVQPETDPTVSNLLQSHLHLSDPAVGANTLLMKGSAQTIILSGSASALKADAVLPFRI